MDFHNPDRRVTLIAVDEKWTRLLPWAVVAALGLLVTWGDGTPEVKAKPIAEIRDKFEYVLLEPQADGTLRATRGLTFDDCNGKVIALLEARLASVGEPSWVPNSPPPDCILGDLIEAPQS